MASAGECDDSTTKKSSQNDTVSSEPLFRKLARERIPCYSAILQRTAEEGVKLEELEALRKDLEAVLTEVALRKRCLKERLSKLCREDTADLQNTPQYTTEEIKQPSDIQNTEDTDTLPNISPSNTDEEKEDSNTEAQTASSKLKIVKKSCRASSYTSQQKFGKYTFQKRKTQNKFWDYVQLSCRDVRSGDIKNLDKEISKYENNDGKEYEEVPKLGSNLKRANSSSNPPNSQKKVKYGIPPGPLTQRLLLGIIQEEREGVDERKNQGKKQMSNNDILLPEDYAKKLENCVTVELQEQGLIDDGGNTCDELLGEIRKHREELKEVHKMIRNYHVTSRKRAVDEMARQRLKRKLDAVDKNIIKIYKKIKEVKLMKLRPPEKYIQKAETYLLERGEILKVLDGM